MAGVGLEGPAREIEMPERRSTKVGREAYKYVLRLPDELREFLSREAKLTGRSMNSEILARLEASRSPRGRHAQQAPAEYRVLSDSDRAMLAIFKDMTPEKQLALISLFK